MAFIKMKEEVIVPSVDIRGYAKYVLREGTNEEKRDLLGNQKSRIMEIIKTTRGDEQSLSFFNSYYEPF